MINKEYFIESLEAALTSAYKKNFGEAKSAFVKLNPEKNSIKVYSYKTVVEEVTDPDKEISLQDAKYIKKSLKVGSVIQQEETPKNFGRIAAQTAKQVIMQKLKEIERENMVNEFEDKEGELLTSIVRRIENGNVYGCSYIVKQCGKTIFKKHYGVTGENKKAVDDSTIFRLASMTKPITAVATLINVDRGLISLEDTVNSHIPQFKDKRVKSRT